MPHYRYQHVPGHRHADRAEPRVLTIKQCISVASQFGRKRVLSETYGCSSWEFTFEGQKWVGDWQYVLGVNLRCQHLALYTLRGCRKRDYPPAFNYNTTWWKYNEVVEDYFARVGACADRGRGRARRAHDPPRSPPVWAMLGEGAASLAAGGRSTANGLTVSSQALLATHYDCDLGDEQIMAEESRIEGRDALGGAARLPVAVVPPETKTLLVRPSRCWSVARRGGQVIVVGEPPCRWWRRRPPTWRRSGSSRVWCASPTPSAASPR